MHFARRTDFDAEGSAFGEALRLARRDADFLDLTVSNPTHCGIDYPVSRLLPPLADEHSMQYEAHALGMQNARRTLSDLYRDVYGADVPIDRLLLTASTSEAYSYLLRLFCEPGDAILVPSPSYPLFDLLGRLHDVELIHYPLVYHDGWQLDPASLAAAVTPQTRAIVAIHPNNPTGHYCSTADREVLREVARKHDLPLIVDEVFLDYALEALAADKAGCPTFAKPRWGSSDAELDTNAQVLTFVLGGLSKMLALPQMKLAWMAVCGDPLRADEAMQRLQVIADTFLSVATPPQLALPYWLQERTMIQGAVLGRIHANLHAIDRALEGTMLTRLRVEGGWAAVLRVPALERDVDLAIRLLRGHGVAVHPGSFYGFPERGWLVISLLPETQLVEAGIRRLLAAFEV